MASTAKPRATLSAGRRVPTHLVDVYHLAEVEHAVWTTAELRMWSLL
jgi:hypothetical protein